MHVIKRNGKKEEFNVRKIVIAIQKALASTGEWIPEGDIELHFKSLEDLGNIKIETIQDSVEEFLMKRGAFKTATSYIKYRYKHSQARVIKDRLDYMSRYSQSSENASTSSETDDNANVTIKNVSNLEAEVYKTNNRLIQRQRMKEKLHEMFPEVANQYIKDLENHIIYTHDEASSPVLKPYCKAISLYPLLTSGTSTMDGLKTIPPTNLTSFCGQLINLTFLLSAQCKGAVAFGEFFNFFDYFCVEEWGEEYDLKEDLIADTEFCIKRKTIGQKIEQAFQNIVYSWNQPAGNRGYQSPFVNISYYDSNYWHSLFDDFVFPDGSKPQWRRIDYLQRKFMKWFNKERTKTLLTFPVNKSAA